MNVSLQHPDDMFKLMGKKIMTILRSKNCLTGPMGAIEIVKIGMKGQP